MSVGRAFVIGAGLSGLAAALALSRAGWDVSVWEAAGQAGGRCRSFIDAALGRTIDNGNHLVLSGNKAVADFLAEIAAGDRLVGPERAAFPFLDLRTGERWTVRPSAGPIPFWIFSARRRIPGTRWHHYLQALRLPFASDGATVTACVGAGPLFDRFWEPLTLAVLNAEPGEAAARLLWPVLRETFGRGEGACRPRTARESLSHTFAEPALATLRARGADIRLHCRLRRAEVRDGQVIALEPARGPTVALGAADAVVLAVGPEGAADLVPGLAVPEGSRTILNGHFLLPEAVAQFRMVGLVGGLAHWIFVRGDVASVTVSAAPPALSAAPDAIAPRLWAEIGRALEVTEARLPPHRIVIEKRATFAQVPDNLHRRPGPRGPWRNLFLAGDWTDTGLPATIEGSLRSGASAAHALLAYAAST